MRSPKFTIWYALLAKGIIGLHFFDDEVGNAVTINGACYHMLNDFFLAKHSH